MDRIKFGWLYVEWVRKYKRKDRIFWEPFLEQSIKIGWYVNAQYEIGAKIAIAPRAFAIFIKVLRFYVQVHGDWREPQELVAGNATKLPPGTKGYRVDDPETDY